MFFFVKEKKKNKKTRGERKGENGEKSLYFRFAFPKMWGFFLKKKGKTKRTGKRGKEREKDGETDGKRKKKVGKEGFLCSILRNQGCILFISPFPKMFFFVKKKPKGKRKGKGKMWEKSVYFRFAFPKCGVFL